MSKTYNIGVLPGDGIGPEITDEAMKVLMAAAKIYGTEFTLTTYPYSGSHYIKTGETLPESAIEEFKALDALYLGALGHPDLPPGTIERPLGLGIRFIFDQYINLRPVKLYPGVDTPLKDKTPEDIDYVVVRENTEGFYSGVGGFFKKGTPDEVATQTGVNTRKGVERCIRYSFDLARKRNKKKTLTLVGKTNVLNYASNLWERVFHEVGEADYPDIKREYAHADACVMWMVKNPEWFDVIVTENMFGDIITDLGAMTQGGMGIAASGNINPEPGGLSMFESIGGSAPKYAGKNVINPLAATGAVSMMAEYLGEEAIGKAIENAVIEVIPRLKSLAAGKMGYSTSEVGDMVEGILRKAA